MSESRRVIVAVLTAFVTAMVLLVSVVLPAEFDIDPLGTGEVLGLSGLGGKEDQTLTNQPGRLVMDRRIIELAPFESFEIKYQLLQDASMVFSITSSREVVYDLHAEPEGAEAGYAESFDQGRTTATSGVYRARFAGIHGWFFENRGDETLEVVLEAAGFFDQVTLYRDGYPDVEQLLGYCSVQ